MIRAKASAILLVAMSHYANADVAVIVHPSNLSQLDKTTINRMFMGREKSFSNGDLVIPIGQHATDNTATEFNQAVLNKSARQLKAYWSKLVFTGKGRPPKEVANDAEMIDLVASNPNFIGYVDAASVTDDVKVVATF